MKHPLSRHLAGVPAGIASASKTKRCRLTLQFVQHVECCQRVARAVCGTAAQRRRSSTSHHVRNEAKLGVLLTVRADRAVRSVHRDISGKRKGEQSSFLWRVLCRSMHSESPTRQDITRTGQREWLVASVTNGEFLVAACGCLRDVSQCIM